MAAYNYGFPVTYYPAIYPNYTQGMPAAAPAVQNQQLNYSQAQGNPNSIIWVQGEAAAKAYSIPPNSQAVLMDSETENVFYIKATDASGMPLPLRVFEFKEIVKTDLQESHSASSRQSFDPEDYVSKEEFNNLKKQIQNMNRKERNGNAKQSV